MPGRAARLADARGARPGASFQLGAGGHLLGEQRGLDAVEQPSSQPTNCAWAMRNSASDGAASSLKGRVRRSSSSRSSGARPSSSSRMLVAWISRSRLRLASSSGAARTSSSSCLIMVPMRITFAGCSTRSVRERSSESSSVIAIIRGSTPPMISTSSSSLRVLKTSPSFVDYGCGVVPLGRHS